MAEEETHNDEEMSLKAEAEEQARLKAEEEACIAEELRLKPEAKEQASPVWSLRRNNVKG